jgi:Family of unknown function (DUF5335)
MRAIEKSHWASYCERVTRGLVGKQAEIEVDSLQIGAQIQAEWVPILGVDYDPKDDLFEVAVEGLDHLIYRPRELYVEESASTLNLLAIVDGEGARHLVRFRDPLMLPSAGE